MKRKQVAIGVGVAAVVAGLIADIRYNGLVRRTISGRRGWVMRGPSDRPVSGITTVPADGKAAFGFPDAELIRACVHCGLCLPYCPTYVVLGVEMDSPRGRIYQMKLVAEGEVSPDNPHFRKHMYQCLDCRACETACPSGVQYGRLIEAARSIIPPENAIDRTGRLAMLGGVLNSKPLLAAVGAGSRIYQRSGLQTLVRATGVLKPVGQLARMESMLPDLQGSLLESALPPVVPAIGERRARVAFLSGCIAAQFFPQTNRSTVAVLAANGCDVLTPPDQGCCGALQNHSGEREIARNLARHNVDVFERTGADYIVSNAAGCGSMLKEYVHLLADDPRYAERAKAFSDKCRDVNQLLAQLGLRPPTHTVRARVTYQDACHLRHGQKVRDEPRELLDAIPGIEFVEMKNSDWCCGSAGIYNVTQPELSEAILVHKMENVIATGADTLLAANPGCLIQLEHGLRDRGVQMRTMHPVDLLAEAYGLAAPKA
jgi:glycolate oxidase iron-sulfur subunit